MVAYSFDPRFRSAILDGTKQQTIRADRHGRARHARPGDTLQLYTGLRTRFCRKLGEAKCMLVVPVWCDLAGARVECPANGQVWESDDQLAAFARRDGFSGWRELYEFWGAKHPGIDLFKGQIILWGDTFVPEPASIAGFA